ncbi:MAG: site-specific integrase [Candidatus Nitrosopolaris sp.]
MKAILETPKVKLFLDSIGRNSQGSKKTFGSILGVFQDFLTTKYGENHNCETMIQTVSKNEINIYELLDAFVSYLLATRPNLTPKSISLYLTAIRSYFGYYDIDVISSKFKRRVRIPKCYREDEKPLDVSDIRKILLSCSNRRLKPYILTLASGGMRALEGLAIRLCDIDFTSTPTKIHIRKEFVKTRMARDIYISDEATHYLRQWIDWKYRDKRRKNRERTKRDSDLVFSRFSRDEKNNPKMLYSRIMIEFQNLLEAVGMDKRKEEGVYKRREITLHSFRRFVKTVISNQVNQDYSEWFLGHAKSPYYTIKESGKREIYATKCMKYLTFLDYTTLEARGKSIDANLQEKEKEIEELRHNDKVKEDALATLSDQVMKLMVEVQEIKKLK